MVPELGGKAASASALMTQPRAPAAATTVFSLGEASTLEGSVCQDVGPPRASCWIGILSLSICPQGTIREAEVMSSV